MPDTDVYHGGGEYGGNGLVEIGIELCVLVFIEENI